MSDFDNDDNPPWKNIAVVGVFALVCALMFSFLWVNSGGRIPVVSSDGYVVSVDLPRAANIVYFSDVMVAGVKMGKVTDVAEEGDHAVVRVALDPEVAPLHQGAKVHVRAKSLVDESYLDVVDGPGAVIPGGSTLPAGAGVAPVQLDDVLQSLDAPTRAHLRKTLRSLGAGTADTRDSLDQAVTGLGYLGRQGHTVVDALAAQTDDLRALTRSSAAVLGALSTRRAALGEMVASTDRLAAVTAGQEGDIKAVMRELPGVVSSARASSDDLTRLGVALGPVAANLNAAAPDLSAALRHLPQAAKDLRATVPALDGTLDRAPATLTRIPALSSDVSGIIPDTEQLLRDVNPMLGYLEPYGHDIASFFTNFAQTLQLGDRWGKFLRVMPPVNEQSFRGFPLTTQIGPLDKFNPLPLPGSMNNLQPYGNRPYPHVVREPVPQ